jgi:hypothetical protein
MQQGIVWRFKMAGRVYVVLPKSVLSDFGHKPKSASEYNNFALVAMKATKEGDSFHSMHVDDVVCWGFKEASLQTLADSRNADMSAMRTHLDGKEINL